ACPGERVALALRPLAGRFAETPPGFLDYAAEVPGYGDRFVPYTPPDAGATALEVEGRTLTGDELTARARERADHLGLGTASRVLSTTELMTWDGLLEGLLAPLAAGASVVLCRNADPAALAARITGERVTTVTG
ncbi:MAG: TIGR03089 family protein, partial [Carbonactinosporaceae bacterium]